MCGMNEGYMETWDAGARTIYTRVRLTSPTGGTLFTIGHADTTFSTTQGLQGNAVQFGTAEDCVVKDIEEAKFLCPPKGSAQMDLSGTPFRVDTSASPEGLDLSGNHKFNAGGNTRMILKCGHTAGSCAMRNKQMSGAGGCHFSDSNPLRIKLDKSLAGCTMPGTFGKCKNGGLCITTGDTTTECVCEPGFTGPTCEDSCDDVHFGPGCTEVSSCLNGGKINSATGTCFCHSGWTGTFCQEYDYCVPEAGDAAMCMNGGNCTNLVFDVVSTTQGQCTFPFTYHGQSFDRCVEPGDAPPFCVTKDGVKADCIIKATKTAEAAAAASVADGGGGNNADLAAASTPGCAKVDEGKQMVLSCVGSDQRVITSIDYAVFGKSDGTCGNYKAASSGCSSRAYEEVLQAECVGKATCVFDVSIQELRSQSARDSLTGCDNRQLAVEYSCGYTQDEGVWVSVDLDMLVRGDSTSEHSDDSVDVKVSDETISTGCDITKAGQLRTHWLYDSGNTPAPGVELFPVGREFAGFPSTGCTDADGAATKKFGMLKWSVELPFQFTQIRGNFKMNKYSNSDDTSTHTNPVDGDAVPSCSWDDANSLEGPDKTGTVLFGTPSDMLYCGGRYGTINGRRTFGIAPQKLSAPTKMLQWQVAQDGLDASIVLTDVTLQVYYPIASQATLDGLAYAFSFNEMDVKTNSFANTFPGKDPKHNALDCDASKITGSRKCPEYRASGVSGGSVFFDGGALPLQFISPEDLGIQANLMTQKPWSFTAWIRPQYRYCGANRYCRNPIMCGKYPPAKTSKGLCLDIVNGRAAVTVDGVVYTTPWKLPDMEWSHVAYVFDAAKDTGRTRVYVNGRESILPLPMSCPACLTGDSPLVIGGSLVESALQFTGYMDELQFFTKALSEYDVKSKGDGRPDVAAEIAFHFDGNYRESRFDGADVPDLVQGKWIGSDSIAKENRRKVTVSAKGISGQAITVPGGWQATLGTTRTLAPINFEKSFTASLWFNPNRPDGILMQSQRGFFTLQLVHDRLSFTVAGATVTQPDLLIPLREWSHVVIRRINTRTTRKTSIFINGVGVEVETAAPGTACPPDCSGTGQLPTDNPTEFYLGGSTDKSTNFMFDEVALYDIALDDAVIRELTSAMGPTGVPADQAQCDFNDGTCGWNEFVDQDVGTWWRLRSGPETGTLGDHTTGVSEGSGKVCDGPGPCYMFAKDTLSASAGQSSAASILMSPWLQMPADASKCTLSFWYTIAAENQNSAKSCNELGWKPSPNPHVPADQQTCGSSTHGKDNVCDWNGRTYLSFAEAEAACLSEGARLCSLDELNAGVTTWTGCAKDNALIWTKTDDCGDSSQARVGFGNTLADEVGDRSKTGECHSKQVGRFQVRCCADKVAASTSLAVGLEPFGSADYAREKMVWSAADGSAGKENTWSLASIPIGNALTELGGKIFMVHIHAGSGTHPHPIGAIDDIVLSGCAPPPDTDLTTTRLTETVVVGADGVAAAATWNKYAKGAADWVTRSGANGLKGLVSPAPVVGAKLDYAMVASKSKVMADHYRNGAKELILGTRSFRAVITFSLQATDVGHALNMLGQRPAFSIGFNDTAKGANEHAVGGNLEIRGDAFAFSGDLFKKVASVPHDLFSKDTVVTLKISRVGSLLTVAADGASSTGSGLVSVEIGPAALGRLEVKPQHSRVVVYDMYIEQANAQASDSTMTSAVDTVEIPVHASHDVGVEAVKTGVVTLEKWTLALTTSDDKEKVEQIVAVRFASVPLSRGDTVKKAIVQFHAAADSASGVPVIMISAALSPNAEPLIEKYGNRLPLVPYTKSTAIKVNAGGTGMISSKVSSWAACKMLSDDEFTYKYSIKGERRNGVATDRMAQLHGKYLFVAANKAVAASEVGGNSAQVILSIECEVEKTHNTFTLSKTPKTNANVVWNPAQWKTGKFYPTADLSPILQEIISQPGWKARSAVTIFFQGTTSALNRRMADGYPAQNDVSKHAPSLVIESFPAEQSFLSQVEATCVFPFEYDGKTYYSCLDGNDVLPPQSTNTKPWCGTARTVEKSSSDWGFCTSHLVQTTGGTNGGSSGNDAAAPCNFPFVFQGRSYSNCIELDDGAGRAGTPWCSLTANYDADKKWGYCLVPTYGGTTPGAACTFPFWYNGQKYSKCTTDGGRGGNQPWCATSETTHSDASPAQWGYCSDGSETERSWGYGCKCPTGFTGHKCQSVCYGDTYGPGCLSNCDACVGGQCSATDGVCVTAGDVLDCPPGLLPPFCLQGCPADKYGAGCTQSCAGCGDGGCDQKTGKCVACPAGKTGLTCSDDCPEFSFGEDCLQPCDCVNGDGDEEQCDAASGECSCDPNGAWIGPKCKLHRNAEESRVFINEIYFGTTTQELEKIEVAGPAGTNLAEWEIHFYYKACEGASTGDAGNYNTKHVSLSGRIPNMEQGYGVRVFNVQPPLNTPKVVCEDYASGLMGSAIALITDTNRVTQFLSYGQDVVASGTNPAGPVKKGTRAEVIPAVEELPFAGRSLSLVGRGQYPSDFTWAPTSMALSLNKVNPGQTFGERTVPAVSVDMYVSASSVQMMQSIVTNPRFVADVTEEITAALRPLRVSADQVVAVGAAFVSGSKGIQISFILRPNDNNLPPLPSGTDTRLALVRIRTIFSSGTPLSVGVVSIAPTCPAGFSVVDDRCQPDLTTAAECPDRAFTCGECVGASSLCAWSDDLGSCKKTDARPVVGSFVCGPHERSCCAALAITHLGPTAACSDDSEDAVALRKQAIQEELNTDAANTDKFEGLGCEFLASECGFDCAPENPDNNNNGNGNGNGPTEKGKGGAVGAVFGVLVVLSVAGYWLYTERKKGSASIYKKLEGIRADNDADFSHAEGESDDDDIAMVEMGSPGGAAFKRHDPNNDQNTADAFGDEDDDNDLLM